MKYDTAKKIKKKRKEKKRNNHIYTQNPLHIPLTASSNIFFFLKPGLVNFISKCLLISTFISTILLGVPHLVWTIVVV